MNLKLETDRLLLQVLFEDQAFLTAHFYRQNWHFLSEWEPNISPQTSEITVQRTCLRYEFEQLKQGRFIRYWYSAKKKPDYMLGAVCFQHMRGAPFSNCEIGYKQGEAYMGHGYATEAVTAAIRHLFQEHSIHRIEAFIEPCNLPSCRLIERLGFEREGTARQMVYLRNHWQDCYRYALIDEG